MRKELHEITLDENWTTPAALAEEIGVSRYTISTWIRRGRIDFVELPSALVRRHLVDRRTVPELKGPFGRPL